MPGFLLETAVGEVYVAPVLRELTEVSLQGLGSGASLWVGRIPHSGSLSAT